MFEPVINNMESPSYSVSCPRSYSRAQKDIKASERGKGHPLLATEAKSTEKQEERNYSPRPLFHRSLPFFFSFSFLFFPPFYTPSWSRAAQTDRPNQYHRELVSPSRGRAHATKTSFSARIPGRRLDIIIRGSPWSRRLPYPLFPAEPLQLPTFFHTRFGELY